MALIEKIVELDGTIIEKPYTEEQLAEVEAAKAETEIQRVAQEAKATEKAALLAKLGITDDEANLLLS
jgi:hypothetical protein